MRFIALTMVALFCIRFANADSLAPFADVHIHYKANQTEVTSAQDAVAALQDNNIVLAVVMGTPPYYALRLKARCRFKNYPFL